MVEKPLAVNASHAGQMIELAREHNIHLLTNYETSWYPSNAKAYELLNGSQEIGPVRKIVFHTGHPGPIEIGCNPEFLEWLTDPVLNGGGALTDFGCYGANLATWLMRGLTPLSVTAVTQQIKPDKYPKVEDEATIVLTYPKAQVIIEASWNWPYSRKDMELYGRDGYVFCLDRDHMIFRKSEHDTAMRITANPLADGLNDPFSYLAAVIRGRTKPAPFDLSSPENNGIVVRILDAAKLSAKTGKTIPWHSTGPNQQ
jgi:predicted dehydrogenase